MAQTVATFCFLRMMSNYRKIKNCLLYARLSAVAGALFNLNAHRGTVH